MMKVEVKRLGVLQTGKVLAALYGFFAVIMIPFGILVAINTGDGEMIVLAFLYPILGFVGGIVMAAVYNLIAKHISGGFRVELEVEPLDADGWDKQAYNG